MQATETLKLILGIGEPLIGRLVLVDALSMRLRETEDPQESGLRRLRPRPDGHAADRLRGLLRRGARGRAGGIVFRQCTAHVPEVTVEELKAMRDRGDAFVLVDVREAREWAIADLADSVKIPLGTLPQSLDKLSPEDEIVVYCRSGARSANAVQFLLQDGLRRRRRTSSAASTSGRSGSTRRCRATDVRRVGLIFLAIGLGGFLLASQKFARYQDAWETARWMLAGVAVMGIVFTIFPGKPEPS